MSNLPTQFVSRMKTLLGDDYPLYEKAMSRPPVRALRVNTDKISVDDFKATCPFEIEPIPYVANGFYFEREKVGNHPFHHAGLFYVQEPAAMAPAECVEVEPDWWVLDMCAAPGGKSTQLKNKLGEKGVLVSNEIIPSRCKILTGNIERLGLKNSVTTCMDTTRLANLYPKTFNLVMVDAPCSGEGMFRKEEIAISEWSQDNVTMCATRQAEILENAAKVVKGGGYIVYATCTFSIEENEMTVDNFLKKHPEFELVPVSDRVQKATAEGIEFEGCACKNIRYARRFYPHLSRGEGQFMALLHNTCEETKGFAPKNTPQKIDKVITDFLDDTLADYDKNFVQIYNGNPVYFTPDFSVSKGTAFMCGVTIGEVRKNYIQPHHQFFSAMGDNFKRKIDLAPDDERLHKYLRGEQIEADCPNGWAVVSVCGSALGGVKVVSGVAKNHYPKGLRLF
ncbi:MAG: hypothetical protein IJF58_00990 [Clostridia bacterium]|nr:hypothetical protein [Clostridia bacterium]